MKLQQPLLIALVGLFALFFNWPAAATMAATFNKIVIFGDSLSDNGNLHRALWGFMPKSPPYYQGRFSNGPIWSDQIAKYFLDTQKVTTQNDAVGAETADVHNPLKGYLPYSLKNSLDRYYSRTLFKDRAHTLFIIWLGSNDYLHDDDNIERSTDAVIHSMQINIEGLIRAGAKHILLFTIPDRALTPLSTPETRPYLHAVTVRHNSKLLAMVAHLQQQYPTVNLRTFDAYAIFSDIINNLPVYNERYHTHIKNITDPCWTGPYYLKAAMIHPAAEIRRTLVSDYHQKTLLINDENKIDLDYAALARIIAANPDLQAAYTVGKQAAEGHTTCAQPDDYVFWDHVHLSTAAHGILSSIVIDHIKQFYHPG